MFDKLLEAQQKAGEVKKRLDAITVTGTAEGGKITVTANGNKQIQAIDINPDFFADADKEELEELLLVAINKAIEQAENSTMLNDFVPDKNAKYALIFGNEVYGVSDAVMEKIDECLEIPQFGTKHSFNIVVSAGIVLWDFFFKLNP